MTTYRLEQIDGGTITLQSGRWHWFVSRVNSLPEGVCESQQLIFANELELGDIMRTRIPAHIEQLDDREVTNYARNPDEREFRTTSGRIVIGPAEDQGRGRMWPVRPEPGNPYRTTKFVEKPLGELTAEELRDIAR
jgi:hypothetical protein